MCSVLEGRDAGHEVTCGLMFSVEKYTLFAQVSLAPSTDGRALAFVSLVEHLLALVHVHTCTLTDCRTQHDAKQTAHQHTAYIMDIHVCPNVNTDAKYVHMHVSCSNMLT